MILFFFNDTATTEIYTLSLHDALPIYRNTGFWLGRPTARLNNSLECSAAGCPWREGGSRNSRRVLPAPRDRKNTRLNSSHANISSSDFCLNKKRCGFSAPVIHRCFATP